MKVSVARARQLFYALLVLLTAYHIGLLGRGALAFPDEHVSLYGLKAVDALRAGDIPGAARAVSGWGARPAENLLRLPAAFLQKEIELRWGLSSLSIASLMIATAQNVVVSLLLSWLFFELSRRFFSDGWAAFGAATFSLLSANHVWIRHVVPYDAALLVHLWALRQAVNMPSGKIQEGFWSRGLLFMAGLGALLAAYPLVFYRYRGLGLGIAAGLCLLSAIGLLSLRSRCDPNAFAVVAKCGLASGIALALYPAYYAFVPLVGAFIVFSGRADRLVGCTRVSLAQGATFGFAVSTVVFGFETLARLGGISYLGGARLLSQTLDQGDYSEGFVYLAVWLGETDPLSSVWMFPLAVAGVVLLLHRGLAQRLDNGGQALARVVLLLCVLYLVYAAQSALLQKVNFSGRYARMYLPALVLAATYLISQIPWPLVRRATGTTALALSVVGFIAFARAYQDVGYPVNVLVEQGIRFEDVDSGRRVYETEIVPNYNLPVWTLTEGAAFLTRPRDERFTLVNFGWFDLRGTSFTPYVPRRGDLLIQNRPHFQCFVNSLYEGFPSRRRQDCRDHAFRLRIYQHSRGPDAKGEVFASDSRPQ